MKSIKEKYLAICQKIGATKVAPSNKQIQIGLFTFGVLLLTVGLTHGAAAELGDRGTEYKDTQIARAVTVILAYLEGSFGALIMVAAGLGAILSSAFGQYRAALGCLVVAVGSFILRSVMNTFFNTQNIDDDISSINA